MQQKVSPLCQVPTDLYKKFYLRYEDKKNENY